MAVDIMKLQGSTLRALFSVLFFSVVAKIMKGFMKDKKF